VEWFKEETSIYGNQPNQPWKCERVPLQLNKKEIFRITFWLENDFMKIVYFTDEIVTVRGGQDLRSVWDCL